MDSTQMLPPSEYVSRKSERSSNLELYRILVMLLIVAHHYVVNSGLVDFMVLDMQSTLTSGNIFGGGVNRCISIF